MDLENINPVLGIEEMDGDGFVTIKVNVKGGESALIIGKNGFIKQLFIAGGSVTPSSMATGCAIFSNMNPETQQSFIDNFNIEWEALQNNQPAINPVMRMVVGLIHAQVTTDPNDLDGTNQSITE